MVAMVPRHDIGWVAPAPLWGRFGDFAQAGNRERFARPAILRFAHDAFMDELFALLAYHPEHLDEWLARHETWERPMRAPPTAAKLSVPEPASRLRARLTHERTAAEAPVVRAPVPFVDELPQLKLYQPVHNRYYLVTASLVCRRPGLPDRRVDPGRQEQVRFVLRRLLPAADAAGAAATDPRLWREHAFVQIGNAAEWRPVGASADRLLAGEERLPMFGFGIERDAPRRQLVGGLIPVGRREAYVSAGVRTGAPVDGEDVAPVPGPDTRLLLLQMQVTGPWGELVTQALDEIERFADSSRDTAITGLFDDDEVPTQPDAGIRRRVREQIQTVSWYALLDFTRFLRHQLPRIWEALTGARPRTDLDPARELPLLVRLEQTVLTINKTELTSGSGHVSASALDTLAQALQAFALDTDLEGELEDVEVAYDRRISASTSPWPDFLFPLADVGANAALAPAVGKTGPFPFTVAGENLSGAADRDTIVARVTRVLEELEALVEQALPAETESARPEIVVPRPQNLDPREAWFTIRCVYERPNCGPRQPEVLSLPTEPFRMAGFFDPDAPARPIRIPMPFDISLAGLRKYNKNATLMISDALCGQLRRIRKFSLGDLVLSVLPWPFHKDLTDPTAPGGCTEPNGNPLGMFCSLSIPIVTLCALILLIIMVALFDLFFRWLPFLFLCLPIPGLKGKRP